MPLVINGRTLSFNEIQQLPQPEKQRRIVEALGVNNPLLMTFERYGEKTTKEFRQMIRTLFDNNRQELQRRLTPVCFLILSQFIADLRVNEEFTFDDHSLYDQYLHGDEAMRLRTHGWVTLYFNLDRFSEFNDESSLTEIEEFTLLIMESIPADLAANILNYWHQQGTHLRSWIRNNVNGQFIPSNEDDLVQWLDRVSAITNRPEDHEVPLNEVRTLIHEWLRDWYDDFQAIPSYFDIPPAVLMRLSPLRRDTNRQNPQPYADR